MRSVWKICSENNHFCNSIRRADIIPFSSNAGKQHVSYAWHWTVCCWWIRCIILIHMVIVTSYLMCGHNIYCAFGARPGSMKCQGYNSTSLKPSLFLVGQALLWNTGIPQSLLCLQVHWLLALRLHCVDFLNVIWKAKWQHWMSQNHICKHLIISSRIVTV